VDIRQAAPATCLQHGTWQPTEVRIYGSGSGRRERGDPVPAETDPLVHASVVAFLAAVLGAVND